jgi:hypothetical protein
MMKVEPLKEHQWLNRLLGEWTSEMEMETEPGRRERFTGTDSVRTLDGIWFIAEGRSDTPDGDAGSGRPDRAASDLSADSVMTLGYDPQRKRYVGTFIASMMTHLWIYEGELDADERVLTLNSEGPSMTEEGKMAQYRDSIEFKSDDHRLLTSHVLAEDGSWQHMMTAEYRRKK